MKPQNVSLQNINYENVVFSIHNTKRKTLFAIDELWKHKCLFAIHELYNVSVNVHLKYMDYDLKH